MGGAIISVANHKKQTLKILNMNTKIKKHTPTFCRLWHLTDSCRLVVSITLIAVACVCFFPPMDGTSEINVPALILRLIGILAVSGALLSLTRKAKPSDELSTESETEL